MKVHFSNQITGEGYLSDEHAASSYGIPVFVDKNNNAYGKNDSIRGDDDLLNFYLPQIITAGDMIKFELEAKVPRSAKAIEMAKKFLGK